MRCCGLDAAFWRTLARSRQALHLTDRVVLQFGSLRAPHGAGTPTTRGMLAAVHAAEHGMGRRCLGAESYAIQ